MLNNLALINLLPHKFALNKFTLNLCSLFGLSLQEIQHLIKKSSMLREDLENFALFQGKRFQSSISMLDF
jgi:hypothetical protein